MKHLTVDEIIDFVSISTIETAALEKAAMVTTHIRDCGMCMRRVRAFQLVYDTCIRRGTVKEFGRIVREMDTRQDLSVQLDG